MTEPAGATWRIQARCFGLARAHAKHFVENLLGPPDVLNTLIGLSISSHVHELRTCLLIFLYVT